MIQIDVKKIIRNQKNPTIKNLPGFVIAFIKWLIKEKELNKILRKTSDLKNYEFNEAVSDYLNIKYEVIGAENIPDNPQIILAGNHALGGIDFFALTHALQDKFPKINHITNEILMAVKPIEELCVPVNVFGKNSNEQKQQLEKRIANNSVPLTIFPSGEVMRKDKGVPDDGLWRSGFIRFAQKYHKDVVPFYIPTENSKFFYALAKWRKKLGIKANIELFLLPRELVKQRNKTIRIIFGKPIPFTQFDDGKSIHEWAAEVKKQAYALANQVND